MVSLRRDPPTGSAGPAKWGSTTRFRFVRDAGGGFRYHVEGAKDCSLVRGAMVEIGRDGASRMVMRFRVQHTRGSVWRTDLEHSARSSPAGGDRFPKHGFVGWRPRVSLPDGSFLRMQARMTWLRGNGTAAAKTEWETLTACAVLDVNERYTADGLKGVNR